MEAATIKPPAVLAAEQYRRATEMAAAAKEQMLQAIDTERDTLKIAGVARIAGIDEHTLYGWISRRKKNGD
jgi:transposase